MLEVKAAPVHKACGVILLIAGLGCWAFLLYLFPDQPIQITPAVLPLWLIFLIVYRSVYLDHHSVVYEVDAEEIRVIRKGVTRRTIPLGRIERVLVSSRYGGRESVVIVRKGHRNNLVYLTPLRSAMEVKKAIVAALLKYNPDFTNID